MSQDQDEQCDQIGRFVLKLLETNYLTKVAQIFVDFLGQFEKHHFQGKTATFGASFGILGLLLISTSGHTDHESEGMPT